jgi:hypothetical protein
MFFQDPSTADFQRRMGIRNQLNNLPQLFDVATIPKDSQLREVIDSVDNELSSNKSYNTLEHQGYHLEHSFGHGKNTLATTCIYSHCWLFSSIKSLSSVILPTSYAVVYLLLTRP